MYYDNVKSVIEGNDIIALREAHLERVGDHVFLRALLELRNTKEYLEPEESNLLRLHVTDGATHMLYGVEPLVEVPVEEAAPVVEEQAPVSEESAPPAQEEAPPVVEEQAPASQEEVSAEEEAAIEEAVRKAVRARRSAARAAE